MKFKSLLSQLRPDDAARKSSVSSQADPIESRSRRPSFSIKYCETQALEGDVDGRHVFLANRKADNLCVAVKTFGRRKQSESELLHRQRIGQEYIIGSQLRHINMIRVFDLINEPDGEWLQVMEYAPNNLFDRVGTKKMSQEEIDCSFLQIAAGVNYLHACGFAHRDLKLENIVYTNAGVMKIIDFGAATLVKKPGEQRARLSREYVGSLPYMAPEIIQRTSCDPQCTDVWSLAILYCCMLLRSFPWKQANITDPDFVNFVYAMEVNPEDDTTNPKKRERRPSVEARMDSGIVMEDETKLDNLKASKSRLPQCLPPDARPVISAMLNIDWPVRLTMRQVMRSSWVRDTKTCASEHTDDTRRCTHRHT